MLVGFLVFGSAGAVLVAVCELSSQPQINSAMRTVGLFCHMPFYYCRIYNSKERKTYEQVHGFFVHLHWRFMKSTHSLYIYIYIYVVSPCSCGWVYIPR